MKMTTIVICTRTCQQKSANVHQDTKACLAKIVQTATTEIPTVHSVATVFLVTVTVILRIAIVQLEFVKIVNTTRPEIIAINVLKDITEMQPMEHLMTV